MIINQYITSRWKIKTISCKKRDIAMKLSQVCLPIDTSTFPQAFTMWSMQLVYFLKYFIPTPYARCVSKLLIPPNNCPVLKILGLRVPSLASKVSPSPLQVRSSPDTGSPQQNHGTVPRHFRRTVLQTRFRWWKELLKTPKMLLSVVRTSGWVFKVCWVYFKRF